MNEWMNERWCVQLPLSAAHAALTAEAQICSSYTMSEWMSEKTNKQDNEHEREQVKNSLYFGKTAEICWICREVCVSPGPQVTAL